MSDSVEKRVPAPVPQEPKLHQTPTLETVLGVHSLRLKVDPEALMSGIKKAASDRDAQKAALFSRIDLTIDALVYNHNRQKPQLTLPKRPMAAKPDNISRQGVLLSLPHPKIDMPPAKKVREQNNALWLGVLTGYTLLDYLPEHLAQDYDAASRQHRMNSVVVFAGSLISGTVVSVSAGLPGTIAGGIGLLGASTTEAGYQKFQSRSLVDYGLAPDYPKSGVAHEDPKRMSRIYAHEGRKLRDEAVALGEAYPVLSYDSTRQITA